MFCRSCHYDLRGQIDPRCPECSQPFSFDSQGTYLPELCTAGQRARAVLETTGLFLLRLILILLMIASLSLPRMEGCRGFPTIGITLGNLQAIMTEWTRQCGGHRIDCLFDKELARTHLPPRVSPVGDLADMHGRRACEEKIRDRAGGLIGSGFFGWLLALTYRNASRKFLLWMAAIIFVLGASSCALSTRIAEWRHPGSHAYLDEYYYLTPPFAPQADGWDVEFEVVAVEKLYTRPGAKMVGISTGKAMQIHESMVGDVLTCAQPLYYQNRAKFGPK